MKNRKFTLGVIAGMSSLALAVPVLAQVSSAATGSAASSVPTQDCVGALAAHEDAMLATMDAMFAAHKAAATAHRDSLKAAADIADEAARDAAVKKAQDDFHAAMKAAMASQPDPKAAMDALRAVCGDSMRGMMGHGFGGMMMKGHHRHGGPGKFAEKLGMTEEELKTALDSGKTIEDIAKEKGVELPAHPMMRDGGRMFRGMESSDSSQTAQ